MNNKPTVWHFFRNCLVINKAACYLFKKKKTCPFLSLLITVKMLNSQIIKLETDIKNSIWAIPPNGCHLCPQDIIGTNMHKK